MPSARAWKNAACRPASITRFPFICKSPIKLWAIERGFSPGGKRLRARHQHAALSGNER